MDLGIPALARLFVFLAAALAGLAMAAGSAGATVTSSEITSVREGTATFGSPFFYVYNAGLATQPNLTITGQTNGTTGDLLDVECLYSADGGKADDKTVASGVPVGAGGKFSVTVALPDPDWACRLAALPSGSTLSSLDVTPFRGPELGAGYEFTTQDASRRTYDYESDVAQLDLWNKVRSPSAGGLCLSYLTGADQNTNFSDYSSWGNYNNTGCTGAAALYGNDGGSRSELQVDGRNGYLGYWAATGGTGNTSGQLYSPSETPANRADISLQRSFNPKSGDTTVTDAENIVQCRATPDPYPATGGNCGGTVATGLRLNRTIQTSADGQQVTISDRYHSVDGRSHKLDVEYDNNTSEYDQYYQEWKLPGSNAFTYEAQGSPVSLGSSSLGTIYVQGGYAGYFDPYYNLPAAFTYTTQPSWAKFIYQPVGALYTSCDDKTTYPACDLVLDYQRTVPAGGSITITHIYTSAQSLVSVEELTTLSEDSQVTPVVKIIRPVDHLKTSSPHVFVVGTAQDLHGLRSLFVNGVPLVTDLSGNWSLRLTLSRGRNVITAVATNLAGRTAQAQDHIQYIPPKKK